MFCDVLLNFRVRNNLTQKTTAEILGTTQRMVSLYETAGAIPRKKNRLVYIEKMKKYETERKF